MNISRISFNGEKQLVVSSDFTDDIITLQESYLVADTARGAATEQTVTLGKNNQGEERLIELTFGDGTTWFAGEDTLEDIFPEAANPSRSADDSFKLPTALRSPTGDPTDRGLVSDTVIKLINVFTKKKVAAKVGELAKGLENRMLENQSGLYKVSADFVLTKAPAENSNGKPYLLFLHGTASSTAGSFKELTASRVWKELLLIYGTNILAFQHESLTKSPLQNVAELIGQLPANAELHLVSHSRGGLVGDVLSRYCNSNERSRGFDTAEKDYLRKAGNRQADLDWMADIEGKLENKKLTVTKFVRVACPANGTTLASKRLDNFLNITLNLVGLGTGAAASPIYGAFRGLIASVIETKDDISELPGIEAMNPNSPFIKILNNPASTIEVDNPLVVISGNCSVSFSFRALLIIASKIFYLAENDLVVNTLSMYQGAKRSNKLTYLFDDLNNVDHFHYFKNEKTSQALLVALQKDGNLQGAGFKTKEQQLLAVGERNALLKLDGGAIFRDKVTGSKPIVVVLPGIMGSNLSVQKDGANEERIWINYWKFITGGLTDLTVNASDTSGDIQPLSIVGTSYARLVQYLEPSYDVVTFAYDWRLPLTAAAKLFNDKINHLLSFSQPIRIIGHSMGGVLVRDFIINYDDTWQKLNKSKGFRLLFLGSPLGGSYRIPAVLFGKDPIIDKLAKIDIRHTKQELLHMFSKFKGLLSLLPLPVKGDSDLSHDFARPETWTDMRAALNDAGWPLPTDSGNTLNWFKDYYTNIADHLEKIDYSNMVYIAGKDKATPCGYRVDEVKGKKELTFLSTGEGDQSVTWETGIPRKMKENKTVYYVNVTHGSLANEPKMFDAIAEILTKGATGLLSKTPPAVRGDEKIFKTPALHDFDLSEAGVTKTLLSLDAQDSSAAEADETKIRVMVSNSHLKYAAFPVLAGHFAKDGILNAEGEVDKMLGNALSERHRLNLYPGPIGSSEVIITNNAGVKSGIIVGLGNFGELTPYLLTTTVEQGVTKYLLDANSKVSIKNNLLKSGGPLGISSLIIGSGYGGISIEGAVRSVLQGIQNANNKLKKLYEGQMQLVEQVEFIELYEDRALSCSHALGRLLRDESLPVKFEISKKEVKRGGGSRKRIASEKGDSWWTRITIKMDKPNSLNGQPEKRGNMRQLRFSISNGGAREERRDLLINPAGIESMIADSSVNNLWSPRLAKTLFEILIPVDFKEQLKRQNNINWILDEDTAAFPWELLQDNASDAKPLSVNAGMIRQLGIDDYRMQVNAISRNTALVVAAPDLDGFLPALPGAVTEGTEMKELFDRNSIAVTDRIESNAREILQEIHGGYKIIHLAGHGEFNKDFPEESGMVIGRNNFLTSAYISNMSTVPELVFINCCYLGQVKSDAEERYRYAYKLAANIGTQLIKNGVKAVVAAGWAINDAAALLFAREFYEGMFEGDTFGDAIRKARQAIYEKYPDNNTWGAYQCYGDPYYKLRNDRQTRRKVEKEYVIAEEAFIDLNNLHNEVKAGGYVHDDVLTLLGVISDAIDTAGLRNADITEQEALIYASLALWDIAIAKFRELLTMERADFSVSTLERYSNVRMKKYCADYLKTTQNGGLPSEEQLKFWMDNTLETISGIRSLLMISETAERYNLLGSAYKRKGILCGPITSLLPPSAHAEPAKKKSKKETAAEAVEKEAPKPAVAAVKEPSDAVLENRRQCKLQAYQDAAYNYWKSTQLQKSKKAYALVNWYSLESILIVANGTTDYDWGKKIVYQEQSADKEEISYTLPTKEKVVADLEAYIKQPDDSNTDYWLLVELPNCKLCVLIVNSDLTDAGWKDVLDAFVIVWNKSGSRADKLSEIENLQLLSDALAISEKEGATSLRKMIDKLKDDLLRLI